MSLTLDPATFWAKLAALPVAHYEYGECVLAAGGSSGRLLVLKSGAVEVVKDGARLALVAEPGAMFGELSLLLGRPHTADVRATARTEFYVADAARLLADDPATLAYVAVLLARRLDATNQALVEVRHQLQTGQPASVVDSTVARASGLLNYGAGGDIYDPFEPAVP
jgi:CRP-like cAMP-binding protein